MTSSGQGKIIKKWILAYLGAITYIVVPLYMKRGYYGLIRAKAMAYLYCAIPALIAVFVVEAAELSSPGGRKDKENTGQNSGRTSQRPYVSGQYSYNLHMVFAVMAVSTVINLFAVIQSAGIDLFGLLKNIEEKQHYTYLSTIGQKNSYSGYLCLLLTRKLSVFAGKTARFKGISKAMIQRPVAEIIFVCAVGLYFFGWKVLGSRIGKYILIVIELAAIGIICAYAVKTTRSFHDKWGTNRGMTWRVGWEQFLQFPLRNKLVGVGPEMLVTVYAKMRAATGRNVVSAHCEPLQVLLTQGIIGLCIYFAFWGYLLKLFFFQGSMEERKSCLFFPSGSLLGAVNILLGISGHGGPFQFCGRYVFKRSRRLPAPGKNKDAKWNFSWIPTVMQIIVGCGAGVWGAATVVVIRSREARCIMLKVL